MTTSENVTISLREITDKALAKKADKNKEKIEAQVKDFFAKMEPFARDGHSQGKYLWGLCKEAQDIIKSRGVSLEDHGGNICNCYVAKW